MKNCIVSAALLSAGVLWADCPVAERPTTEAEQKYYVETFNALRTLIPPAPAGWQIQDRAAKMVATVRRPTPEEQAKLNDLEGRSRTLTRDAQKIAATDKAAADKMTAESRELANQARELRTALLTKPEIKALEAQRDALVKEYPRDIELSIQTNMDRVDIRGTTSKPPSSGATLALGGAQKTILARGAYTQAKDVLQFKPPAGLNKTYGVVVEAKGDPQAAAAILSGLNGAAVAQMIGK